MKLKKVLFGSLLMSVAFAACTNEELLEVNAPADLKGAVSLGEGYTIEGVKGINSRYVISAGANGALSAVWEKTDTVGGAWIGYQTEDQVEAAQDDFNEFTSVMSNHPFAFDKGSTDMTVGKFSAPTNVYEGKYILYYPFNYKMKAVGPNVPVKFDANPVMDCTAGKELDHVNANTFAWGMLTAAGGPEAGTFSLNQAGNVWVIKLGVDAANVDRAQNQVVEKIIIEASDKFYNEGYLKANGKAAAENKYAKYTGVYNDGAETISTYILSPENATADYQITAAGATGMTKKPFYLSTLRAKSDITEFTVRAIMANGRIFSKKIELDTEDSASKTLFQKITRKDADGKDIKEGKIIELNVILDTEEVAGSIYTVDQFNKAMAQSNPGEIILGADITLPSFTFNKKDKFVTITGSKLIVKGDMEVTAGTLEIENLNVEGELNVAGILTADMLDAEDAVTVSDGGALIIADVPAESKFPALTVSGTVEVKAPKYTSIEVGFGSEVTVNGGDVKGALVVGNRATVNLNGKVVLSGTTTVTGELATATPDANNEVVNKGTLKMKKGSVVAGTYKNQGTVEVDATGSDNADIPTYIIENNGTVKVSGKGEDMAIGSVKNNAAVTGTNPLNAGKMEIDLTAVDDETMSDVTPKSITFATATSLDIKKGELKEAAANDIKVVTGATMNVGEKAVFTAASGNASEGLIVIEKNEGAASANLASAKIAAKITANSQMVTTTAGKLGYSNINTIILAGSDIKIDANEEVTKLQNIKNLILMNNVTFAKDVTLSNTTAFSVEGSVTLKHDGLTASVVDTYRVLTIANGTINGSLVVGKGVTLKADPAITVNLKGTSTLTAEDDTTSDNEDGKIVGISMQFVQ